MGKSKLVLKRLDTDTKLKPFCCSDTDLNGFLFDDATNYSKELLAVTYLLETEDMDFLTNSADKVWRSTQLLERNLHPRSPKAHTLRRIRDAKH